MSTAQKRPPATQLDRWGGPSVRGRLLRAAWRTLRQEGAAGVLRRSAAAMRQRWQLSRYDWTPRRVWLRLHRIPIDRPIFILGVQGGGTTVLARCLYRHSKVVYAGGNSDFWAGIDEIHNSPHVHGLPEAMIHRSKHFFNAAGKLDDHPRYGLQRAWLYAVDELLPQYVRTAEDADAEAADQLRSVIRRIIRAYAHDPFECRFVDMSQLYTIQLPYLARLLEGCEPRFILAARDPYVTCARAAEKEYAPDRGSRITDPQQRIRLAVEHWTNSYRLALEGQADLPMMVVRYEDFVADPAATIQKVCEFAELDFEPAQVPAPDQAIPVGSVSPEKWYPLRADENERYLARLDGQVVSLLDEKAGDLIERLGYRRLDDRN